MIKYLSRLIIMELTHEARENAWKKCGKLCPMVFAFAINPQDVDKDIVYPSHHMCHMMVHTKIGALLTTDGLSNPFDERWKDAPHQNGFKVELYYMTDEPVLEYNWESYIDNSMLRNPCFQMLGQVEEIIAKYTHSIYDILERDKFVHLMIDDRFVPKEYWDKFSITRTEEDGKKTCKACVLLGLEHDAVTSKFDGPLSKIRFVNVKLLTNDEFFFMIENSEKELAEKFQECEDRLISSFDRKSII